jgi:hypothetical protein
LNVPFKNEDGTRRAVEENSNHDVSLNVPGVDTLTEFLEEAAQTADFYRLRSTVLAKVI